MMNGSEIREWFQRIIELTREFEEDFEEDPILAVDLHNVLPDFWDEWFSPLFKEWNQQARSDLRQFFLNQMELYPGEIAVRYAALAVYDGLIRYLTEPFYKKHRPMPPFRYWYLQEPPPRPHTDPAEPHRVYFVDEIPAWEPYAALLHEDLRCVLHFVDINDIGQWREIRWEISNSCLAEDWDRAFQLYDRASKLGVVDECDLDLLRGQLQYLLALRDTPDTPALVDVVRIYHPSLREPKQLLHPSNWEPQVYDSPDLLWSCLLLSSGLVSYSGKPEAPEADRGLLREAIDSFERAQERGHLPAPYGAALSRCYFAAGRYYEAAAMYRRILDRELDGQWVVLTAHLYRALSGCYVAAEEPVKAIGALQECAVKYPEELDIYLRGAELQAQQSEYDAVVETIRNAADNLPGFDEDWRYSSLLALGGIHAGSGAVLTREMVPREHRAMLEWLLGEYWPTFRKLSDGAKELWIIGTYLLVPSETRISDCLLVRARVQFVIAVEIELRETVFSPIRKHFQNTGELLKLVQTESEEGVRRQAGSDWINFCRFVAGRRHFNLGLATRVLSLCGAPSGPIAEVIRGWLDQNCPKLIQLATCLDDLREYRNAAEHGSIVIQDGEDVRKMCRQVIDSIV